MSMKIIGKWMGMALLMLPTLLVTDIMAQELKKPTLEDLIPGGETYRYAENLYGIQWWGDMCIKPGIDSLLAINAQTGKETLLVTREKINHALQQEKLGELETTLSSKPALGGQDADSSHPARKLRRLRLGSRPNHR